jgi:hypothetical protein
LVCGQPSGLLGFFDSLPSSNFDFFFSGLCRCFVPLVLQTQLLLQRRLRLGRVLLVLQTHLLL